jgi:hypothetical protein
MKRLITIGLVLGALFVGCQAWTPVKNVRAIPEGYRACRWDEDCRSDEVCTFKFRDTPAVCVW